MAKASTLLLSTSAGKQPSGKPAPASVTASVPAGSKDAKAVCPTCKGAGWVRAAEIGEERGWQVPTEPCDCQTQTQAQKRWERALRASDIAPKLLALDFAGYDATHNDVALNATATWTTNLACTRSGGITLHPWLLIYGGMGTGKTHLLAAAFNTLLGNGRYPLYTLVPALLDHIRDGLDAADARAYGSYSKRFKAVREAPILLLDDLGAEKRSEWSDELLFKLLDYRYREGLPTAVASNLIPGDLEPRIASRLQDRVLSTVVLMSGPDYRLTPPPTPRRETTR